MVHDTCMYLSAKSDDVLTTDRFAQLPVRKVNFQSAPEPQRSDHVPSCELEMIGMLFVNNLKLLRAVLNSFKSTKAEINMQNNMTSDSNRMSRITSRLCVSRQTETDFDTHKVPAHYNHFLIEFGQLEVIAQFHIIEVNRIYCGKKKVREKWLKKRVFARQRRRKLTRTPKYVNTQKNTRIIKLVHWRISMIVYFCENFDLVQTHKNEWYAW